MSNALKDSAAGLQLILDFEVGGGETYYTKFLRRPTYPGAGSGVTIGVGYDLGYHTVAEIRADWSALDSDDLDRLVACQGKTGASARTAVAAVKDIEVSWAAAFDVFKRKTIPKYWLQTRNAFAADNLPAEGQWALLSLVFNRGASMSGDRRKQMRQIRDDLKLGKTASIPQYIKDMIPLWQGKDIFEGMKRRRNAEAALFAKGTQGGGGDNTVPPAKLTRVLSLGSKGDDVKLWQKLLGIPTAQQDGDFGPNTSAETKKFQRKHGLIADGMVGPRTFNVMMGTVKPKS